MGQKVNPHGLRVGVIKDWDSRWFAEGKDFSDNLVEDHNIRKFLKKKLEAAAISKIEIERAADRVKGIINVVEVKSPDLNAQLVAETIAGQLENRVGFRRAVKQSMQRTMRAGALGIKAAVSGRLSGADIARSEFYSEGTIPLQTIRADIDYGFAEADTTYGKIGVKVWIYKGEILPQKKKEGSDK